MKIIQRGILKVLPGKMAEYMELQGKFMVIAKRHGCPPMRCYRYLTGGEYMHTVVCEAEWDSLATMEAYYDKAFVDPEWQALMPKWEAIIESHELEFYTPMPQEHR